MGIGSCCKFVVTVLFYYICCLCWLMLGGFVDGNAHGTRVGAVLPHLKKKLSSHDDNIMLSDLSFYSQAMWDYISLTGYVVER